MKLMKPYVFALAALVSWGCGKSTSGDGTSTGGTTTGGSTAGGTTTGGGTAGGTTGGATFTVKGTLSPFPFTGNPNTPDYSNITIGVNNPETLLSNPNAAPLASSAAINPSTQCLATGCEYSVSNVSLSGVTLGLIATADNGNSTQWMPTATGIATGAMVSTATSSNGNTLTANPAFLLSQASFQLISEFTGLDANTLLDRGLLIGYVVGKPSEASAATNGVPPGIQGATVTLGNQDPNVQFIYPNAAYDNVQASTNPNGLFFAFPKDSARLVLNSFGITPPTGDQNHTWTAIEAGSAPGKVLIVGFEANP